MEKRQTAKRLIIEGLVQGVGFRPFVYRLAHRYNLKGWVRNTKSGVEIDVSGIAADIDAFCNEIKHNPPSLAIIKAIKEDAGIPETAGNRIKTGGGGDFNIIPSGEGEETNIFISSDVGVCRDCAADFANPDSRFYNYPFVNCTECGPRYSIITDYPYDRINTTMNGFVMCDECAAEYKNIHSRRYHAEPVSCPDCGPEFTLLDKNYKRVAAENIFDKVSKLLAEARIIAVKGVGGYHLIADALNESAVRVLRERKKRDTKPFAVLFRDMESIEEYCHVTGREKSLLLSKERPIVLLKKKKPIISSHSTRYDTLNAHEFADPLSGSSPFYGAMLPYAPFHYLLLRHFAVLVCTSGNISGEPIVYRDDDIERLESIADFFLTHNRKIVRFVEDSVAKIVEGGQYTLSGAESPASGTQNSEPRSLNERSELYARSLPNATNILIRKSRGYAPLPLFIKKNYGRSIAGLGADLKGGISLLKDDVLFQSQYLGDLADYLSYEDYIRCYDDMKKIFRFEPDVIACDLHPAYYSTRFAGQICKDIPLIKIQHHKAHIAAVCLEKGWFEEDVIGIALDGTGYGDDGAIWGGEVFKGSLTAGFERAGHLSYMPLPFGDSAVKDPKKTALTYFVAAGIEDERLLRIYDSETKKHYQPLKGLIKKSAIHTSSTGRLFDAVSFLLGFRRKIAYEGEAAIELENLIHNSLERCNAAGNISQISPYNTVITEKKGLLIFEVLPVITDIFGDWEKGESPSEISLRFHHTIIEGFMKIVKSLHSKHGITKVVMSGGSFQNNVLLAGFIQELEEAGLTWAINQYSPPNDACVSMGQCALAACAEP